MSKDRLAHSGHKYVTSKGRTAQLPSGTNDVHYTTMGVTLLRDRKPVFAVVIFEKKTTLMYSNVNSFDPDAKWIGDIFMFDSLKQNIISKSMLICSYKENIKNYGLCLNRIFYLK